MTKRIVKDRVLTWDILGLAESVTLGESTADHQFFKKTFGGNCLDLFFDRNGQSKPAKPRLWTAIIKVHARAEDGTDHYMDFELVPEKKMTLKQFMDEITPYWLDECDKDLEGMDCVSATAIAKCRG